MNFNIQSFRDSAGTIENMGIDNVEQIRKNAQIAKAIAQRDIAIATAQAQEEVQRHQSRGGKEDCRAECRAVSPAGSDAGHGRHQKAEADAAYSIQQESQRKTIEITKANADIARRERRRSWQKNRPAGAQAGRRNPQAGRRHEVQGGEGSGGPAHSPPAGSRSPEIRSPAAGGSPEGGGGGPALFHGAGGRGHPGQGFGRGRGH